MGGTIAKHVSKGDKVCAMCLTDGTASRNKDEKAKTQRAIAADLAAKEMGYEWVGKFDLPDNALDSVPLIHIVKLIEEIKDLIQEDLPFIKADKLKENEKTKFSLPNFSLLKTPTKKERENSNNDERNDPKYL